MKLKIGSKIFSDPRASLPFGGAGLVVLEGGDDKKLAPGAADPNIRISTQQTLQTSRAALRKKTFSLVERRTKQAFKKVCAVQIHTWLQLTFYRGVRAPQIWPKPQQNPLLLRSVVAITAVDICCQSAVAAQS